MISRLKGNLVKQEQNRVIIDIGGISYEVNIPLTVSNRLTSHNGCIELVIYHYFNMDKHRAIPVMIGFLMN